MGLIAWCVVKWLYLASLVASALNQLGRANSSTAKLSHSRAIGDADEQVIEGQTQE